MVMALAHFQLAGNRRSSGNDTASDVYALFEIMFLFRTGTHLEF